MSHQDLLRNLRPGGAIAGTGARPAGLRARDSGEGSALRLCGLAALLLALGAAGTLLRPALDRPGRGEAALNGAAWEGRRLVAQLLWLKTHAVLHAGVEEREARPGEELSRAGEVHLHGSAGDQHHEEGEHGADARGAAYVQVIPPAKEDFRGILGHLERAVKPYSVSGSQAGEGGTEQTLPFYRLITWADPHYIQGYVVGAAFLGGAGQYANRGLEFLREGERNNPGSFEIQVELGHFYLVYKKEYADAERHLRRALELLPRNRRLTDLEADARLDAYRWLALDYVQWGRPAEAVAVAAEGTRVVGPDITLGRVLSRRGQP